jgi:hypothetical protein
MPRLKVEFIYFAPNLTLWWPSNVVYEHYKIHDTLGYNYPYSIYIYSTEFLLII